MKKIIALTASPVVVNSMTIDRAHPMDVWNEEILQSEIVRNLLATGKIAIIDEERAPAAPRE